MNENDQLRLVVRRRLGLPLGDPSAPTPAPPRPRAGLARRLALIVVAVVGSLAIIGALVQERMPWAANRAELAEHAATEARSDLPPSAHFSAPVPPGPQQRSDPASSRVGEMASVVRPAESTAPQEILGPAAAQGLQADSEEADVEDDHAANERLAAVVVAGLRLRLEPTTAAPILQTLAAGTPLVVLPGLEVAEELDWLPVRTLDGTAGWVAAAAIRE